MTSTPTLEGRILIVDDNAEHNLVLERTLRLAGYRDFRVVAVSSDTISAFDEFRPDLVLLDLGMPGMDGMEILNQLHLHIPPQRYLPIVILTADLSQESKRKALSMGAKDFITKPFDEIELLLRIATLLETRFLHRAFQRHNRALDKRVRDRTQELEDAQLEILHRLAVACEYRDDDTGHHAQRVGDLAASMGRSLGLPEERVQLIRMAAPLHDVGKIGLPDQILLKRGKLTVEEYALAKTHTIIGGRILSGSRFPILQLAEKIALYHHEHWDGNGYRGLLAEATPLEARMVSVTDAFDVMTHGRPYKEAWPIHDAVAELHAQRGRQFDPHLVDVLTAMVQSGGLEALSQAVANTAVHPSIPIEDDRVTGNLILSTRDILSTSFKDSS